MMVYKITNRLNTSLTIEDLGFILSAGESRRISADAYARSEDIRRQANFIKIDTIYSMGEGPIINKIGLEKPIITVPIPKTDIVPVNDPAKLEKKLDDIHSMLSELMNQKTPAIIQQVQTQIEPVQNFKEPMFIPNSIVPNNVEFSTQVSEQQVDKDIGNSKAALKKLRKK